MKSQPQFFSDVLFSIVLGQEKKQYFFLAFMVRFSLKDLFFRLISTLKARFNQELHCLILLCRALID